MNSRFYSYLDDFDKITIIYPAVLGTEGKTFILMAEDVAIPMAIIHSEKLGGETKFVCSVQAHLELNRDYSVHDEQKRISYLRIGKVVRSDLFDMTQYYDGNDLGATYSEAYTTFKLWTPVAKEVELEWVDLKGIQHFVDATYTQQGVWVTKVMGNLDQCLYRYRVRVNERFETTLDPYAIASNANALYNAIIDMNKLEVMAHPKPDFSGYKVDAVIYEIHVRDMTIDHSSGAENQGTYLGLTENSKTTSGHPTGLDHIAMLGSNHLQLMPVYDFGGVDETNKTALYNWGYNPVQYNVPEGWYATNPNDPYNRINELRKLIDTCHQKGLRVIMDVVYNHVYDMRTFPFEKLVPGYFYRFDEHGMKTEVSGCKNDIASERKMARKFILDSVAFWMRTYRMSGFRFDLMGLLDVETMNRVVALVESIDSKAIVYGEGWNMQTIVPTLMRANMNNHRRMPKIGHFNDAFRDAIKGSTFGNHPGYATGGHVDKKKLNDLFMGSVIKQRFFNPNQSINYVECHDNHTFFDKAKQLLPQAKTSEIKDYSRLALSFLIFSQGAVFIHAGQEFLRTKQGVENSYKSPDAVNKVNWALRDVHEDLVTTTRDLLVLRNNIKALRLRNAADIARYIVPIQSQTDVLAFKIMDVSQTYFVYFKTGKHQANLVFGKPVKKIFDGVKITSEVMSTDVLQTIGMTVYMEGE